MKSNTSKTDFRKSPRNNKVSPTRASPKNASEKASPNNKRRVASPKAGSIGKVGQSNGSIGKGLAAVASGRTGYNTATAASSVSGKKKTEGAMPKSPVAKSHNFDKGAASKSWDHSAKVRPGAYSSNTSQNQKSPKSQTQKSKMRQTTNGQRTTAVARGNTGGGSKAAPVTAKTYGKSTAGATAANNKAAAKNSSYQQNVSKKIQGLKDL